MGQERERTPESSGLELDWKGRTPPADRATLTASASAPALLAETGVGRGAPGDPRHMSLELKLALAGILEGPGLTVRQQREWGEALLGWETRNRYEALDSSGRFVLFIGETGEGWGQSLLRNLWPFRQVEIECMTQGGTLALSFRRPWTLFFTRLEVTAWDGRPMGFIQQRFGLLHRTFELCTPAGGVMATLEGPLWRPWTFRVLQKGAEMATIRKQWSGFFTEAMTDADTFGVEFSPDLKDGRLRQMVLAATLLVDLCYFEKRSTKLGGLSDGFTFLDILNIFD